MLALFQSIAWGLTLAILVASATLAAVWLAWLGWTALRAYLRETP